MKNIKIVQWLEESGMDVLNLVVCGSDGFSQVYKDEELWNHEGIEYFRKIFGNIPFPQYKPHCICGVHICENCYITTSDYNFNNIIIVGNCCIKSFLGNEYKVKCLNCDEPHINGFSRKKGLCDKCKEAKKTINKENRMNITKSKNNLINDHKKYCKDMFKEFKMNYDPIILNAISFLNNMKNKTNNYDIQFNINEKYSIVNVKKDNIYYSTINLFTMKPTKNSPNNILL